MICVVYFLLFVALSLSNGLKIENCSGKKPIITVDYAKVEGDNKGVLDKSSVLKVEFTNRKVDKDEVRYNLKLNVERKLFFKYMKVPQFILTTAARQLQHPDLKYIGKGVFQMGCEFLGQYSECPPPVTGKKLETIKMKTIFDQINSVAGSLASYIGSGTYRVNAMAWNADTKEGVLCINIETKIQM